MFVMEAWCPVSCDGVKHGVLVVCYGMKVQWLVHLESKVCWKPIHK